MQSSNVDSYFVDGLLTVEAMEKIIHSINSKLPEEEKINLMIIQDEEENEIIEKIKTLPDGYKKNIIAYIENKKQGSTLYHADPFITSKTIMPNGSTTDLYFLHQPKYSTEILIDYIKEEKPNGIVLKILNDSSKTHPQADHRSCFSLAIAILKDMTKKEFEKNIKNNETLKYIPNSLIKYSQVSHFLKNINPNLNEKHFINKRTGEIISAKKYRKNKKDEGNGYSTKLSGFSSRVLEKLDNEDFSLSDLSSHESYESEREKEEIFQITKKEERERSRERKNEINNLNRSKLFSSFSSSN